MFYIILFLVNYLNYFSVFADIVYPCHTPDAEKAYCTSLFSCPHLMKALGSLESSEIEYVRQSICLGCEAGDFMVCCGSPPAKRAQVTLVPPISPTTTSKTTTTTKYSPGSNEDLFVRYQEAVRKRLLPDEKYCGYQHTDDRPYNSSLTALDEFPWLVHVRFSHMEYDEQYADRCSGVLINNRYVLTDAYCGAESIKVKLGEYNTNQTVSCDNSSKIEECSEPVFDVPVVEIIRDGKRSNGRYDFTLLRLAKPVQYSDFIRPICLPIDQSKRPNLKSLVFSGWGAPDNTGIAKKRLTYDIVKDEDCYKEENWLKENVESANGSFICTKPPTNPTALACSGEHGGPFMYSLTRRIQWYVEGVIVNVMYQEHNDHIKSCNNKYLVNGIRITENTIDWILSTIRP